MSEEPLRKLLERVHERLGRAGSLDERSREMLTKVMGDIDRALNRPRDKGTERIDAAPRLEALAVRFESEHPQLAGVLRQVIDALGKAGI